LHASCIAVAEVLNGVWKHVHLVRDLDADGAVRALRRLGRLVRVLKLHDVWEAAREALEYALNLGVTFYDAAYVALAVKPGQDFYTFDMKLASKLSKAGLPVRIVTPDCPGESIAGRSLSEPCSGSWHVGEG